MVLEVYALCNIPMMLLLQTRKMCVLKCIIKMCRYVHPIIIITYKQCFKKKKNYIQPVICPWLTFIRRRFLIAYHETIPILKFPAIELDRGMCGTYRDPG